MSSNVSQYLLERAASQPGEPAVRVPLPRRSGGRLEYLERSFEGLEADASATVRLLRSRGVERGQRVLLMVRPGLDLIRIVFALFKMGAVPVVIDPGMGLRGFLGCVRQSQPQAVVGIPAATWVARVFRKTFGSARVRIEVNHRFQSLLNAHRSELPLAAVETGTDELAAILFTSGSTGPAKGVRYTHGIFDAQVKAIRDHYAIVPGEVDLPMLPVFALFNPAMGMTTVVPEMNPSRPATVDPARIVEAIHSNQVTNSFGSPALWSRIAGYCERTQQDLPSIKRILVAGAPVPPALMRRMRAVLPNGEIHTPYGATESLPISSIAASEVLNETQQLTEQGAGTCVGRPLPGIDLRIVRPVDGPIATIDAAESLPTGAKGEIIVRGAVVTPGYDGLPAADARSKIRDGDRCWHRMGDLGYTDRDGRLWFCGRQAECVASAEGPLYTDCCEAIFNTHPRVFRSALIGSPGGIPAIVIEPVEGEFPKGKAAQTRFASELAALGGAHAGTAAIRHFFFERSFPVDVRHNAKIHRLTLARQYGRRIGS